MPHFIVEYSTNLESSINLQGLADEIRDVAVTTGVFPLGGIRVRLHPCAVYTIADGQADAGFVHIMLRIGAGRDLPTQKNAADAIFAKLEAYFADQFARAPFALSFEICEIDAVLTYMKNNIHQHLKNPG